MSSPLHDGPRGSAAVVERRATGDDHLSAQPSRTPGESPSGPWPPSYITVRSGAATRSSRRLTEIGHPRLATLLDSLIDTDRGEIIVHLAEAALVDAALLQLLRAARARLSGGLTVTADRAETRFQLTLAGLDGRTAHAGTPRAGQNQATSDRCVVRRLGHVPKPLLHSTAQSKRSTAPADGHPPRTPSALTNWGD